MLYLSLCSFLKALVDSLQFVQCHICLLVVISLLYISLCVQVRLSKVYLRDSTMISAFPILLFGGSLAVQHRDQLISVDGWIQFKVRHRILYTVLLLRQFN